MSLRSLLCSTVLLVMVFLAGVTATRAQTTCSTPSAPIASMGAIDTILYVTEGNTPLPFAADMDDGTHPTTTFTSNGTGQITVINNARMESATVNGTTVCHGSTGTTTLPSGDTATIEVNTSSTTGRPYIRVTVDELR